MTFKKQYRLPILDTQIKMHVVSRFAVRLLIFVCLFVVGQAAHAAEKITIAAAADLKFAMDEIAVLFNKAHPADQIETIYGSSGKFYTQIQQGAESDPEQCKAFRPAHAKPK